MCNREITSALEHSLGFDLQEPVGNKDKELSGINPLYEIENLFLNPSASHSLKSIQMTSVRSDTIWNEWKHLRLCLVFVSKENDEATHSKNVAGFC